MLLLIFLFQFKDSALGQLSLLLIALIVLEVHVVLLLRLLDVLFQGLLDVLEGRALATKHIDLVLEFLVHSHGLVILGGCLSRITNVFFGEFQEVTRSISCCFVLIFRSFSLLLFFRGSLSCWTFCFCSLSSFSTMPWVSSTPNNRLKGKCWP